MSDLGIFHWYDYMAADVAAARAFYTETIGWGLTPFDESDDPYMMLTVGEQPVGGVMQLPPEALQAGAKSHWQAYIGTDDIGDTVNKAKELGATVLMEFEMPNVGKIATLRDPQGVVFAAFQPDNTGTTNTPGPGIPSWHDYMGDDGEAGLEFYSALFGWEKTTSMDSPGGPYQMYGLDGNSVGGFMTRPPEEAASWLYYISVDDLDATSDRIKQHGGKALGPAMEVPGGDRIANFEDPQGARFALHEVAK